MNKPVRRTETVTREYWVCEVNTHRHQSQLAAQRCINKTHPRRRYVKWTGQRLRDVARRHQSGESFTTMAKEFHVGVERMRQVVAKGQLLLRSDIRRTIERAINVVN